MLTRVDDKIWIIDTMALGRPATVAAYLIKGKETALIDTGYASSAEIVRKDLADSGLYAIDHLLPTHVHLDHSGACGTLAAFFDTASIRVHPKGEQHLIDPTKLCEGARVIFGDNLMKAYGRPQPISASRVKVINDGEEIDLGKGMTLRSVWTPGHASHHLSYFLEEIGAVFTGDAVGIRSKRFPILIPTTPPTSFNLEVALGSLQRLRQLSPKQLLTPHYGVVGSARDEIDANIRSLEVWVAKIGEMLKAGTTIDSMVALMAEEISRHLPNPMELPDFLLTSIRLSVLGVVRYLNLSDRRTRIVK